MFCYISFLTLIYSPLIFLSDGFFLFCDCSYRVEFSLEVDGNAVLLVINSSSSVVLFLIFICNFYSIIASEEEEALQSDKSLEWRTGRAFFAASLYLALFLCSWLGVFLTEHELPILLLYYQFKHLNNHHWLFTLESCWFSKYWDRDGPRFLVVLLIC